MAELQRNKSSVYLLPAHLNTSTAKPTPSISPITVASEPTPTRILTPVSKIAGVMSVSEYCPVYAI